MKTFLESGLMAEPAVSLGMVRTVAEEKEIARLTELRTHLIAEARLLNREILDLLRAEMRRIEK